MDTDPFAEFLEWKREFLQNPGGDWKPGALEIILLRLEELHWEIATRFDLSKYLLYAFLVREVWLFCESGGDTVDTNDVGALRHRILEDTVLMEKRLQSVFSKEGEEGCAVAFYCRVVADGLPLQAN